MAMASVKALRESDMCSIELGTDWWAQVSDLTEKFKEWHAGLLNATLSAGACVMKVIDYMVKAGLVYNGDKILTELC